MSGQVPEVTHPKFRMWLPDDGVVRLVWSPPVPSGFEDSVATIEAMIEVTGDRPVAGEMLLDVGAERGRRRQVLQAQLRIRRTTGPAPH